MNSLRAGTSSPQEHPGSPQPPSPSGYYGDANFMAQLSEIVNQKVLMRFTQI